MNLENRRITRLLNPALRNFILGLTTIVGIVGLVTLLMLFGELDALLKPRYTVTLHATNASGLRAGSAIELNGVPIGVVQGVLTSQDPKYPVEIVAAIEEAERIPASALAYSTASLLGGSATLSLEAMSPLQAATDVFLPTDGRAQIVGAIRSRLFEQVRSELDTYLLPIVDLAANLSDLVKPVPDGDADAAGESIRTIVRNVNVTLEKFQGTLGTLEERLAQIDSAITAYEQLADSIRTDAHDVTEGLKPVLTQLAAALEQAKLLTTLATDGPGALSQLLKNPDAYRNLTDSLKTLDEVLEELKQLIEKTRREGIEINL